MTLSRLPRDASTGQTSFDQMSHLMSESDKKIKPFRRANDLSP